MLMWEKHAARKVILKPQNFAIHAHQGVFPYERNEVHPSTIAISANAASKNFAVWKVTLRAYNFMFPIYQGIPRH